ncbi:MAG: sugar phosphate isomerase/epimerase [Clostridia bacterium]|nr:sugar phosphate isomerase/epimerase [Clostridia bacterium]
MEKRLLGLSVSGTYLTNEGCAALRAGGVDSVEISDRPQTYPTLDWAAIKAAADANGIRLNSVHLPFSNRENISHLDAATRAQTIATHTAIMKNAAAIGIGIAVLHPSAEPIADADRAQFMANSKHSLAIMADYAAAYGMTVAVEDLPRTCLGRNSAEMAELLTADARLRVCFDTNHLLGEPIRDFVRALGDKFITLHVSDYDFIDERHVYPGEGKIDWIEFMDLLDEVGYKGIFTYETGMAQETKSIRRVRAVTPADVRANYESLVARAPKPVTVGTVETLS